MTKVCGECGKQFELRRCAGPGTLFCGRQCRYRAYKRKNPDYWRAYHKAWSRENPVRIMLNSCKQNAKKKGLVFKLTAKDIVIPKRCPVFGLPFVTGDRGRTPSVDRIDNTKGYIRRNIQVISRRANTMKADASPAELRKFARWILRTFPP